MVSVRVAGVDTPERWQAHWSAVRAYLVGAGLAWRFKRFQDEQTTVERSLYLQLEQRARDRKMGHYPVDVGRFEDCAGWTRSPYHAAKAFRTVIGQWAQSDSLLIRIVSWLQLAS